jgi:hypothetical protein
MSEGVWMISWELDCYPIKIGLLTMERKLNNICISYKIGYSTMQNWWISIAMVCYYVALQFGKRTAKQVSDGAGNNRLIFDPQSPQSDENWNGIHKYIWRWSIPDFCRKEMSTRSCRGEQSSEITHSQEVSPILI